MKLTVNSIHLLWGQLASGVLALILAATLGRGLSSADFGLYYTATSIATFAFVLVDWGQTIFLMQESARKPMSIAQLLSSALLFRLLAAIGMVMLVTTAPWIMGYDANLRILVPVAVASALPLALAQAFGAVFRGWDRMDLDVNMTLIGKLIAVLSTVVALRFGSDLPTVLLVQISGGVAACAFAVGMGRRNGLQLSVPTAGKMRELALNGAPLASTAIALALQPFIDVMLLSNLTSNEVVGWFCAARNVVGLLVSPAIIMSTAAAPELARLSGSPIALRNVLENAARLVLLIATFAAAGSFLFAATALSLIYGSGRFDNAVPILWVSAGTLPLLVLDILLGCVLTALGRHYSVALAKALNVVVAAVLCFVLIPVCQAHFGNGGIAPMLAFALTEIMMLCLFFALLPRVVARYSLLFALARAYLVAAATCALLLMLPSISAWLGLPILVLVFSALAIATQMVRIDDLKKGYVLLSDLFAATRGRVSK